MTPASSASKMRLSRETALSLSRLAIANQLPHLPVTRFQLSKARLRSAWPCLLLASYRLMPADTARHRQVSAKQRKRFLSDEAGAHGLAARGYPCRYGPKLRDEPPAGMAQYFEDVFRRCLFGGEVVGGKELRIALMRPSHSGGTPRRKQAGVQNLP